MDNDNKLRIPNYKQCFILTHNFYFFYNLVEREKNKSEKNQNLFRIYKKTKGSHIKELKHKEIQNDYQAYWHMIKHSDDDDIPGIIANAMRNVIEYFFGFMEKKESLNKIFQKKS